MPRQESPFLLYLIFEKENKLLREHVPWILMTEGPADTLLFCKLTAHIQIHLPFKLLLFREVRGLAANFFCLFDLFLWHDSLFTSHEFKIMPVFQILVTYILLQLCTALSHTLCHLNITIMCDRQGGNHLLFYTIPRWGRWDLRWHYVICLLDQSLFLSTALCPYLR